MTALYSQKLWQITGLFLVSVLIAVLFLMPKSADSAGTLCISFWPEPNRDPPCIIKTPVYRKSNDIFHTIEIGKAVRVDIDFAFYDQYTNPDTSRDISAGHYYDPTEDEYDNYPEPFRLNNDDDNANGILDNFELKTSAVDNDLVKAEIGYWLREDAFMNDFVAEIDVNNWNNVRLWYWKNTFQEITPNREWRLKDLPKEIYIDPIKAASDVRISVNVRSLNDGESLFSDRYVPGNRGSASTRDDDEITFAIEDFGQDQSLTNGDPLEPGTEINPVVYGVQTPQVMNLRTFSTKIYARDDDSPRSDLVYEIVRVQEVFEDLEACDTCYLDCQGADQGQVCPTGYSCIADQTSNRFLDRQQRITASCRECTGNSCQQDCAECSAECATIPGLCPTGEVCAHEQENNASASCLPCNNNGVCEPDLGETCKSCSRDCLGNSDVCGEDELCSVSLGNDKTECRPCNNDGICDSDEACQCEDCHGNAGSCRNGQDCRDLYEGTMEEPLFLCGTCGDFECNAGKIYDVPDFEAYFYLNSLTGVFSINPYKNSGITPKPTQAKRHFRIDIRVSDRDSNSGTTQFDLFIDNYNWSRPTARTNPTSLLGEERPGFFTNANTNVEFENFHNDAVAPRRNQEGYMTIQGHEYLSNPSRQVYRGGAYNYDEQTHNSGVLLRMYASEFVNASGGGPTAGQQTRFTRSIRFGDVGFTYTPVYGFEDRPINPGRNDDKARISYSKEDYTLRYAHYTDAFPDDDVGHPIGDVQPLYLQDVKHSLDINPIDDEVEPPSRSYIEGRLQGAERVQVDAEFNDQDRIIEGTFVPHAYILTRTPRYAERFEYTNLTANIIETYDPVSGQLTGVNYDNAEHGNFIYVPREGYEGLDSFVYKVRAVRGGNVRDIPPDKNGGGTTPTDRNFCGDGRTFGLEQCDEGENNGQPDADCTTTCTRKFCNNNDDCAGICQLGQCYGECQNDTDCFNGQECTGLTCTRLCGNGRIDGFEECDDGSQNSQVDSNCRGDCTLKECQEDAECLSREQCIANSCIDPNAECQDTSDCIAPDECIAGYCRDPFVHSSSSSSEPPTSSSASSSSSSSISYPRTDLYSCPLY